MPVCVRKTRQNKTEEFLFCSICGLYNKNNPKNKKIKPIYLCHEKHKVICDICGLYKNLNTLYKCKCKKK